MKIILSLTLALIFGQIAGAQTKTISKSDFDGAFSNAVQVTNAAFPFIFTVVTNIYDDGRIVSSETDINERQASGVQRETKTVTRDAQTLYSYSVMVGFGEHTYCSVDEKTWIGPQKYLCPGPGGAGVRLYGPRTPETVEYTVTEKSLDGKAVKVYRDYSVFASSGPNGKKDFREKIATIDSRGFFIEIFGTEGTLDPKTVGLTRKQTWDFKTKFKPVVAPK
jgi:hypothetical protein